MGCKKAKLLEEETCRVIYLDAHSPAHLWVTGFRTSHLALVRSYSRKNFGGRVPQRCTKALPPGAGERALAKVGRVIARPFAVGRGGLRGTHLGHHACRQEAQKGWAWLSEGGWRRERAGGRGVCPFLPMTHLGMGQGLLGMGGREEGVGQQLMACDSLKWQQLGTWRQVLPMPVPRKFFCVNGRVTLQVDESG